MRVDRMTEREREALCGEGGGKAGETCFRRLHGHIPLRGLRRKIHLFLEKRIHPEIYFSHRALNQLPDSELADLARILVDGGLRTTVHGPFYDLSPGAVDPAFRALTVERMQNTLLRAGIFAPDTIVFHPGYDPLRFAEHRQAWLRNSLKTWRKVLSAAESLPDTWILIENIFEREPSTIAELLADLPSPPFGFCLDTGHFQLFSDIPLDGWIDALGHRLREVHLHDNSGAGDEHLPPGRGIFDFDALFRRLSSLDHRVIGTIEAHSESDLLESLSFFEKRGLVPT